MASECGCDRVDRITNRMTDLMEEVIDLNNSLGNKPEDLITALAAWWGLTVTITGEPK